MGATNITVTFGSEEAARSFVRRAAGEEACMLIDGKRVYVVAMREYVDVIYEAAKPYGGLIVTSEDEGARRTEP